MLQKDKKIKDNIIENVIFSFIRVKDETDNTTIKDRNKFFRRKKENEATKDKKIKDFANVFELENEGEGY